MKKLKEIKGFTLIELMVTLALLGLVVAGGFSIYFFSNRSFISGSLMADVQADMQIAMHRITEEVRLAHSLKIIPKASIPTEIGADKKDDHYIFAQNGSIFMKTYSPSGGSQNRVILATRDGSDGYGLTFSPVMHGGETVNTMLDISLISQNPKVDYELKTELEILNLRLLADSIGEGPDGAIKFTKTFSEEEYDEVEKVNPDCSWRRHIFGDGASELDQLRKFRDNVLAKNPLGRFVIRAYYASTPSISLFLDQQPRARSVARVFFRGLGEFIIKFT